MSDQTKKCSICKEEKSVTEFYPRGDRANAYRSHCKPCHAERTKSIYERRKVTEPDFLSNHAKYTKKWRTTKVGKNLVIRARSRAIAMGMEFDLTADDIKVPEYCPVLGIQLAVAEGIAADFSPSLDRIDSTKGYTPDNVEVMSYRANRIKNDSTFEEVEKLYHWYLKQKKEGKID